MTQLRRPSRSRTDAGRFYQHGWHSWSVTGWRLASRPCARIRWCPATGCQATDPVHLDDPLPGGSGLGAVETGSGEDHPARSARRRRLGRPPSPSQIGRHRPGAMAPRVGARAVDVFADYAEALGDTLGTRDAETPDRSGARGTASTRDVDRGRVSRKVLADLGDLAVCTCSRSMTAGSGPIGDWEANERFPIRHGGAGRPHDVQSGRTAGMWLAPFLADAELRSDAAATRTCCCVTAGGNRCPPPRTGANRLMRST